MTRFALVLALFASACGKPLDEDRVPDDPTARAYIRFEPELRGAHYSDTGWILSSPYLCADRSTGGAACVSTEGRHSFGCPMSEHETFLVTGRAGWLRGSFLCGVTSNTIECCAPTTQGREPEDVWRARAEVVVDPDRFASHKVLVWGSGSRVWLWNPTSEVPPVVWMELPDEVALVTTFSSQHFVEFTLPEPHQVGSPGDLPPFPAEVCATTQAGALWCKLYPSESAREATLITLGQRVISLSYDSVLMEDGSVCSLYDGAWWEIWLDGAYDVQPPMSVFEEYVSRPFVHRCLGTHRTTEPFDLALLGEDARLAATPAAFLGEAHVCAYGSGGTHCRLHTSGANYTSLSVGEYPGIQGPTRIFERMELQGGLACGETRTGEFFCWGKKDSALQKFGPHASPDALRRGWWVVDTSTW